jgi:hypothetical protein
LNLQIIVLCTDDQQIVQVKRNATYIPYPISIIIGRLENSASPNADGIANLCDLPSFPER